MLESHEVTARIVAQHNRPDYRPRTASFLTRGWDQNHVQRFGDSRWGLSAKPHAANKLAAERVVAGVAKVGRVAAATRPDEGGRTENAKTRARRREFLEPVPDADDCLGEIELLFQVERALVTVADVDIHGTAEEAHSDATLNEGSVQSGCRDRQTSDVKLRQNRRRDITPTRIHDSAFEVDDAGAATESGSDGPLRI